MAWNLQYEKLVEFRQKIGHCIVPFRYEDDKSLGLWVHKQRSHHTKNIMRPDRKKLLVEIGFVWKVDPIVALASSIAARASGEDKKWHQQYKKLVEFKQINGHSIVPRGYEQDMYLGRWAHSQRCNHTKNKMRPDRKKLLVEIGFVWKVDPIAARASIVAAHASGETKKWRQQYEKLVESRQKNGHCHVPEWYEQDKSLGRWVRTQRTSHSKQKMRPDREDLLDELGFAWKAGTLAIRRSPTTNDDSDSEAVTINGVGIPNEALEEMEMEPALGHVRKGVECPSPANKKRPRICLAESGQIMAATRINREGNATDSCCSVETDVGHHEEEPEPSPVPSRVLIVCSDQDKYAVQEEATPDGIPAGWTRTKLQPDW